MSSDKKPGAVRDRQEENKMEMRFFRCRKCGQMAALIKASKCPVCCCGEPMEELAAGTTEASREKHIPVLEVRDGRAFVTVGSVPHPMIEEHYIEWIALSTTEGNQRKALVPGQEPKAVFPLLPGEEVRAVYAYCNLHSLWKA